MKIYIAGQYTTGDPAVNVRRAIDAADEIALAGHIPYIPHLTHFWHMIHEHEYEFWLKQDLEWLKSCDAILRLPGKSAGADREVELAIERGMRVYTSIAYIPAEI